uniref:Uncharacterized protein n=1 Tax=Nothobranchius furzeri TaxID=105023 RepID=A0A8C6KS57_NOTFU
MVSLVSSIYLIRLWVRPLGPPLGLDAVRPLGPPRERDAATPPGPPLEQDTVRLPGPPRELDAVRPPGPPLEQDAVRPPGPPLELDAVRPPGPPLELDAVRPPGPPLGQELTELVVPETGRAGRTDCPEEPPRWILYWVGSFCHKHAGERSGDEVRIHMQVRKAGRQVGTVLQ